MIEGDTDACQEVEIGSGLTAVGFINQSNHVYFAGVSYVKVLDEDSLTVVSSIPNCCSGGYVGVSTQLIVNESQTRVFVELLSNVVFEESGGVPHFLLPIDEFYTFNDLS